MEQLDEHVPLQKPDQYAEPADDTETAFIERVGLLEALPSESLVTHERTPKWKASGSYDSRLLEPIAGPPDS